MAERPSPPPPKGTQVRPPKAPRTGTPAERAARDRPRGALDEWVEQQQQKQLHATWKVRAISAEAAQRDVEACLTKANKHKRAAETGCAALRRDKDRLLAKVKTLERDLAEAQGTGGQGTRPDK